VKNPKATNQNFPQSEPAKEPTVFEIFATLRRRELFANMAIHVFILIPVAVFLAYLGKIMDKNLGWQPVFQSPWNFILAFFCFGLGGYIVWYSYGYLFLKGDGSPGSHLGYTRTIVKTGIYSWVRHPSNIGKLIGVIGLGILMQTPSFIFLIIPVLFIYSLVTTILIQEHFCIKNFGQEYIDYKNEVPMLIPKLSKIFQALTGRKGK